MLVSLLILLLFKTGASSSVQRDFACVLLVFVCACVCVTVCVSWVVGGPDSESVLQQRKRRRRLARAIAPGKLSEPAPSEPLAGGVQAQLGKSCGCVGLRRDLLVLSNSWRLGCEGPPSHCRLAVIA